MSFPLPQQASAILRYSSDNPASPLTPGRLGGGWERDEGTESMTESNADVAKVLNLLFSRPVVTLSSLPPLACLPTWHRLLCIFIHCPQAWEDLWPSI